jgi:ribose transport system ATP-binding protein
VEAVRLESISKRFPGVEVLKGIDLSLQEGRIYGLVGENGAGKSTLIKILMGIHQPDAGRIFIAGEPALIRNALQARREFKMDAVFQEHALIPQMSIAENIFLDRLQEFYERGLINARKLEEQARRVLEIVGLELDVASLIEDLPEADKSLIELSKALCREPRILILDEMTAPLVSNVIQKLFDIIRRLKSEGKTIVFISHRLEEVLRICDEIIVLKDGNLQGVVDNGRKVDLQAVRKRIIGLMTGKEKGLDFPAKAGLTNKGEEILALCNIRDGRLKDVSLKVHRGEIVALAGLRGQGQSQLLRAVAGLVPHVEGEVRIGGTLIRRITCPRDAFASGIFYVSDRRDQEELWLSHDVRMNMSLASIEDRTRLGIIRGTYDQRIIAKMVGSLRIEPPSLAKTVRQLSGGNRQKVVLGKYLLARPRVLLLDQPTIGLDVGAKMEMYRLLRELSERGIPTLAVLTDLEEVLNLPDRILVMHEGTIVREFSEEKVNEEELLDSYYG